MSEKKIFNFQKNKVFIIAEIGFNHEGCYKKCIELIRLASKSGADAIKIQVFNPKLNFAKKTESYRVISPASMSHKDLERVFKFANKNKIKLFSSFGDFDSLNFIRRQKPFCYKISSSVITHLPLINELAKDQLPIIMSTGIAVKKDISNVLKIIRKRKLMKKTFLLHCVSMYPTPLKYANLKYMNILRKKYRIPVGYSDHCIGIDACLAAVSLGAEIIEKHFTFDSKRKGLDHKISLEPKIFKIMVDKINDTRLMLGDENENNEDRIMTLRRKYSRCLVSLKNIRRGEKLTLNNVGFKRTNGSREGMDPILIKKVINKKSKRNLKEDDIIDLSVI